MTTPPATAPGFNASQTGLGGKPNREAACLGVVTREVRSDYATTTQNQT